jgi:hypothetical protein
MLPYAHKPADLEAHFVRFEIRVAFRLQLLELLCTTSDPIDDGGQHTQFANARYANSLVVAMDLEGNHWRAPLGSLCSVTMPSNCNRGGGSPRLAAGRAKSPSEGAPMTQTTTRQITEQEFRAASDAFQGELVPLLAKQRTALGGELGVVHALIELLDSFCKATFDVAPEARPFVLQQLADLALYLAAPCSA